MDKACSEFFEKVLDESSTQMSVVADRMLSGLQYFVSALYLSRQINDEEEILLRFRIQEAQILHGIFQ